MISVRAAALIVAVSTVVSAGTIVTIGPPVGPGATLSGTPSVVTPSPNNDNTASSANEILVSKVFNDSGLVDIPLTVANSGGTTEYYLSELVTNFSGIPWNAYQFELGFGLGASFVQSGLFDFLDFDAPDRDPSPASSIFADKVHDANVIRFSGALWNDGQGQFSLSIDVPDRSDIPEAYWTANGYSFTLRQTPEEDRGDPIVPEPGTISLLLVGAVAVTLLKQRS